MEEAQMLERPAKLQAIRYYGFLSFLITTVVLLIACIVFTGLGG